MGQGREDSGTREDSQARAGGAGAHALPGVSCLLGALVLRFVFRMVKHHVDMGLIHVLKINIHAYFRRKTSGIQNVVFALKTYPH